MNRLSVSKLTCIVDSRLSSCIETELSSMGIEETYVARAKQVSLVERMLPIPVRRNTRLDENRAEIFRFYVPPSLELAALRRIAHAADLFLPGRGSVFAEDAVLVRDNSLPWNDSRLKEELADAGRYKPAEYDLIGCILQRGRGDDLARAMLEMGLCVPVVSFGEGVGMRDRLGLLRITIPPSKEILWLLVPSRDSDFVLDSVTRKAGIDKPGRGFLFRTPVRALAVNTRIYRDRRRHVASMEQIIHALDQLRGSTDWRRLSSRTQGHGNLNRRQGVSGLVNFSIVCQEGASSRPVRAAMDAGAGGATLIRLAQRELGQVPHQDAPMSRARESCDLVVARNLAEQLTEVVAEHGLFDPDTKGFIEIGSVTDAVTYAGG